MCRILSFFAAALMLTPSLSWAIVDIERLRTVKPEDRGLAGETLLQAVGNIGNTENSVISFQNNIAWLEEASDWIFIARYRYGESLGERNANDGFLHLRYSQDIEYMADRWENYIQGDFNEFRNLIERSLVGSNLRWRLIETERGNLSFAAGAFIYRERLDVGDVAEQRDDGTRMNFHLAFARAFLTNASLGVGAFIQPKVGDWEDVHALGNISVESPLAGDFMMSLSLEYRFDSQPPGDVTNYDLSYTTGIKYSY